MQHSIVRDQYRHLELAKPQSSMRPGGIEDLSVTFSAAMGSFFSVNLRLPFGVLSVQGSRAKAIRGKTSSNNYLGWLQFLAHVYYQPHFLCDRLDYYVGYPPTPVFTIQAATHLRISL